MTLVDSHCHLDNADFDSDRDDVIRRAVDAGVTRMVGIGTGEGPPDLEAGLRLASAHTEFYATVGVHPHDAAKATAEVLKQLSGLVSDPKVVAVGEIGLDYHYDFSPREAQKAAFADQLAIARESGKPVVIHTREAWDDTFHLLERHWTSRGIGGIMHCFSGGLTEARRALEMGFHLSFGGIVTFPKSGELREVAREVPLDRMLIETDAPYLAPVPKRGKRNEPAFLPYTAAKLAELRGVEVKEIAAATTSNWETLCLRLSRSNG